MFTEIYAKLQKLDVKNMRWTSRVKRLFDKYTPVWMCENRQMGKVLSHVESFKAFSCLSHWVTGYLNECCILYIQENTGFNQEEEKTQNNLHMWK
jgi:hypothetical protein